MKRIFLTTFIFLAIGIAMYAQQATTQSSTTQAATTQAAPAATPAATTSASSTTTSTDPSAQAAAPSSIPTSAQTKQNAQAYLDQANTNSTNYESTLNDLKTLNLSNSDAATLARLKSELDSIDANISSEETAIRASLNKGTKLNPDVINGIERLINQHKEKVTELQTFIQSIQS